MTRLCSILLLLALCGCKTVQEHVYILPDMAAPGEMDRGKLRANVRSLVSPDSEAVVLPPELIPVVMSWESTETGRVTYYAYYGWSEDAITNLFGTTENWAITNSIPWPDDAENIYGAVYAQTAYGRSEASNTARLPDWPFNAVKVDCVPAIDAQVLLWESPNLRYWAGYWTNLPQTNAITTTTFFKLAPTDGVVTGSTPVTLTIEPLRLWNPEKKHYGG